MMFIEDRETVKPVYVMSTSGNMMGLLESPFEIGNDPEENSSWRTLTLRFKEVQFSGI